MGKFTSKNTMDSHAKSQPANSGSTFKMRKIGFKNTYDAGIKHGEHNEILLTINMHDNNYDDGPGRLQWRQIFQRWMATAV